MNINVEQNPILKLKFNSAFAQIYITFNVVQLLNCCISLLILIFPLQIGPNTVPTVSFLLSCYIELPIVGYCFVGVIIWLSTGLGIGNRNCCLFAYIYIFLTKQKNSNVYLNECCLKCHDMRGYGGRIEWNIISCMYIQIDDSETTIHIYFYDEFVQNVLLPLPLPPPPPHIHTRIHGSDKQKSLIVSNNHWKTTEKRCWYALRERWST